MTVEKFKAMFRSFLTTAAAILTLLLVVAEGLDPAGITISSEWIAWLTLFAGIVRTLYAFLDPGMKLYGVGSNGGDEG
jgi:hypothetical protein